MDRSSIALESLNEASYTLSENEGDINQDFVYSFEKPATDLEGITVQDFTHQPEAGQHDCIWCAAAAADAAQCGAPSSRRVHGGVTLSLPA
jgi:hypothetical protein